MLVSLNIGINLFKPKYWRNEVKMNLQWGPWKSNSGIQLRIFSNMEEKVMTDHTVALQTASHHHRSI
jgi:hypothetical protein